MLWRDPCVLQKIVYLKISLLTSSATTEVYRAGIGETCTCTNTCRDKNGGCYQCIIIIGKLQYLYRMRGCTDTASSLAQLQLVMFVC